jgi:hypothetical protein
LKEKNVKWITVLLTLVLVTIIADIVIRVNWSYQSKDASRHLVIPVDFMYKYPDCANKLIEAANLTNVHMVPSGTLEARRYNQSRLNEMLR